MSQHVNNQAAHFSNQSPSHTTMRRNMPAASSAVHVGLGGPNVAISEIDADNATEFTEQYDCDVVLNINGIDEEESAKRVVESEVDASTEFNEAMRLSRLQSAKKIVNDASTI